MGSSRLPGKVMRDVGGRPMLSQQIARLKQSTTLDEIVIATTHAVADDALVELACTEKVLGFRGSAEDVLGRFVGAAREASADVVVRLTGDCPLMQPDVIDRIVLDLVDNVSSCDYASNLLQRTYPRGLDAEAMFIDTLFRVDRLARTRQAREHVTVFIRSERPDLFECRAVVDSEDNSDLRWTVDTEDDLGHVRDIYDALDLTREMIPYREIVDFVRAHPTLHSLDTEGLTWDPARGRQ